MFEDEEIFDIDSLSEDEAYMLYFKSKLKKSMEDFKNGNFMTLEEFNRKRDALYESYNVKCGKSRY